MNKIFSVLMSIIILFSFSVTVYAEDTGGSGGSFDCNYWSSSMWDEYFGHYDFSSCDFTAFQNFTDYSVMSFSYKNCDDSQYYDGPCYGISVDCFALDAIGYNLVFDRGSVAMSANTTKNIVLSQTVKLLFRLLLQIH